MASIRVITLMLWPKIMKNNCGKRGCDIGVMDAWRNFDGDCDLRFFWLICIKTHVVTVGIVMMVQSIYKCIHDNDNGVSISNCDDDNYNCSSKQPTWHQSQISWDGDWWVLIDDSYAKWWGWAMVRGGPIDLNWPQWWAVWGPERGLRAGLASPTHRPPASISDAHNQSDAQAAAHNCRHSSHWCTQSDALL